MKAGYSSITLKDLENAIKFLNKELTVKDIEDIYGDFNNPRFQAALQEAKGIIKETVSAVNLRNAVLFKQALTDYRKVLTERINNTIDEIKKNIADTNRLAKNIKIAGRYYRAELKAVEMAKESAAEYLKKTLSMELDKLTEDELRWVKRDIETNERMIALYEKRAGQASKAAEKYSTKIKALESDITAKEAEYKELEEKARVNNVMLTRIEKSIYINQLLTLTNVVSGIWEQVRSNIIY